MHFSGRGVRCPHPSDNLFSNVPVNAERKEQPKMPARYWQEWSGWKTSDSSCGGGVWNQKWKESEGKHTEFIREESECVIDVEVNGKVTPVFQESTWNEGEESMTGLIYRLAGKASHFCALTRKPIADEQSEYAKEKLAQEDCTMKYDIVCRDMASFPRSDETSRSRTDRGTRNKLVHIRLRETGKTNVPSRTSTTRTPRKRHGKGIRKAPPTKYPPAIRAGDEQVLVKAPPRPLTVKHSPGVRESASSGSDAWRTTPPTRMFIRKEDVASMIRLRVPSGPPAKGKEVRLSSMISSAPPAQRDDVEMTEEEREVILEILYMNWGVTELDKMTQALPSRGLLVDWILQGDPQHAFFSAGLNDEIEITRVPKQWPVSKEGTTPPEPGFCVRCDSDDDNRKNEGRSPPGPPSNGQPVIHASTIPCAPPETNKAENIKKMQEAIFEILAKERGVLGLDMVIKALKNRNMPMDEVQIVGA